MSVRKQLTIDDGTSNDPRARDLVSDLERVLAHMYAVHIALPDADGVKHHPINCEASRDMAIQKQEVANYVLGDC
jgi:hypothetical protein